MSINGKKVMTGQEWYDGFEQKLFDYKHRDEHVGVQGISASVVKTTMWFKSTDIFKAAKKASGIES